MVISKNQLNLFFSKTSDAFYEGWQSGGWQGPIYSFERGWFKKVIEGYSGFFLS